MKTKGIQDLKRKVLNSPTLKEEMSKDPIGFINRLEPPTSWTKGIFVIVIVIVGLALLGSIVISAWIAAPIESVVEGPNGDKILLTREIDDFFVMIGSTALGALAGMLVPNPKD
ncbi:MAG: hypothetical protein AAFP89_25570 [Bacteroidota bacterium]